MGNLRNKLTLVVLGRSGSGKGTQAKFIVRRLRKKGVRHLETGSFLRSLISKSTPTADLARKVMEKGEIFSSWLAAYTWLKELIEGGYTDKHLVYDGSPRKVEEAKLLDEVMRWYGRSRPLCIYIDATEKESMQRLLLRGRLDDSPAAIRNRMKFFKKDVLPVIRYYAGRGRLLRIDGNPPPQEVWRNLDRALSKRLKRVWPRA